MVAIIRCAKNSRRLAALRASVLLLFLPAHLAFVLLIDLNFIPDAVPATSAALQEDGDHGPDKERLRLHLLQPRISSPDCKSTLALRDVDPWALTFHVRPVLSTAEIVAAALTKPASIRIWLAATPHNHRAPPPA